MFSNHAVDDRPIEQSLRHVGVDHRDRLAVNDGGAQIPKTTSIKDLAGQCASDDGLVFPQLREHQIQRRGAVLCALEGLEGSVPKFPRRQGLANTLLPALPSERQGEILLPEFGCVALVKCP